MPNGDTAGASLLTNINATGQGGTINRVERNRGLKQA